MFRLLLCATTTWLIVQNAVLAAPPEAPQAVQDLDQPGDLSRFASATVKLHASEAGEQADRVAIIQGAGLTVERYNEIAARMGSDPAFAAQVNAALQRAVGAAAPAETQTQLSESQPALPTSGPAAQVLEVLQKVCVPMVREDRPASAVAPLVGFKAEKRQAAFTRTMGEKPYRLTVLPRGSNRGVCQVEVRHPVGSAKAISKALNIWAALHRPELKLRRNDVATGEDGVRRRTLSWEYVEGGSSIGLVFVQESKPDGSPLDPANETARLLYSEHGEATSSKS